jgi:hypothetical protein
MCQATTSEQLEDELSNLLHQLYRLAEMLKYRMGDARFHVATAGLKEARAALWIRTYDTHDLVMSAEVGDRYSDYYTEMYGVLEWKPLASLNLPTDKHGRHLDYATAFECRTVLDTIRLAFDQLAQLA